MESENEENYIGSQGPRTQAAMISSSENTYKLKVVLIGDVNVGKTSLATRFSKDKFQENYQQTIGASFIPKIAVVKSDVIQFQIWDTAGQERFKSLVPMYLRGAHIAFIVYDITNPESFAQIGFWLSTLRQHLDTVTKVLVANKSDLQSAVDENMAAAYAEEHELPLFVTSAKTGYNVEMLFHSIGSKVVDKLKIQKATFVRDRPSRLYQPMKIQQQDTDTTVKKKCCKI